MPARYRESGVAARAPAATAEVTAPHVQRVVNEGMTPAAVADLVAGAIAADRFWVFTGSDPHLVMVTRRAFQYKPGTAEGA